MHWRNECGILAAMTAVKIPYELPTLAETRRAIAEREDRLARRNADPGVQVVLASARSEAAAAARLLRDRFGASRVRVFGSLARGDTDERFDIDLAVEGIARESFFAACAAARSVVTRELDVIDLADASPLLRQRVEQDGIDVP